VARPQEGTRQGQYSGAISRLLAIIADLFIAWWSLLLILAGTNAAISLVIGHSIKWSDYQILGIIIVAIWYPVYFAYQWSLSGKTLGMALFGLRVVTAEGAPISGRQALVRTVCLPISILVFGLGLFGIVLRTDHRGWHDRMAKTCVVYDWDARAARLRWLARRREQGTVDLPAPAG